jgi:hypothetical protein
MARKDAKGSKTQTKGNPPATGKNQDKKPKSVRQPQAASDPKDLSLFLSREYVDFKSNAHSFSERLKPLGLSITQVGNGLAMYKAKSHTFGLSNEIVASYAEYASKKEAWESFRDSFRVQRESATISAEDLKDLCGEAMSGSA